MAQEKPGQTLEPTALVHEAFLRLVERNATHQWNGRANFFGAAAEAMRRILIDNARCKQADKHGGNWQRLQLLDAELAVDSTSDDILAVDVALAKLAKTQPQMAKVVEFRFFAGLSLEEIASALSVSIRTVYRHWIYARAWLRRELNELAGGTR
jgi:RNA polymerase sigma factor (TIGR02999 family)